MYFLEVLCALAAALLFADAETYLEKRISSTPIKDSEMLLYKVTCDSDCDIKAILLGDVSGCLTLEAFSNSIKFCTKNHGNILCPLYNKIGFQMPLDNCYGKSISEKVFWIYLKPEPKFSGGKLKVILGGKGNIQELNYGGASVRNRQGAISHVSFVPLELLRFFSPHGNYVRIKTGFETIENTDRLKQYKISCQSICRGILLYSQTSEKVIIAAAEDPIFFKTGRCYNCFCVSSSGGILKKCKKSGAIRFNTKSSSFYVILIPDDKLTDVSAYILGENIKSVDNYGTYMDGWHRYTYPDDSSKYASVQIESGSKAIKFPKLARIYEIQCNGNCRGIEFVSGTDQKVILAAAEEPVFATDGGCYNCFCVSNKSQGYFQQCVKDGNGVFNLQKSSIYVSLVPNMEIKNVKAFVVGNNIKSMKEYVRNQYGWPVYDTKDGYRAAAFRLQRAPIGSQTLLVVHSTGQLCDDVKIEVIADSTVLTLNVGVVYWSGGCFICSCTGVKSCKRRHMPDQLRSKKGYFYFWVYIRLAPSQKDYPGYVKISGNNIREVDFRYEYNL